MPEPTLNKTFGEYVADIGSFLGWGRGADYGDRAWSDRKKTELTAAIKSGLHKVYWPMPPYEWSFMRPWMVMTLESGTSEYLLPRDFEGFEGRVFASNEDGDSAGEPIRVSDDSQVIHAFQKFPDSTGLPRMIAEIPQKGVDRERGSQRRFRVWPTPDAAYTLKARYHFAPDILTASHPYAYGGTPMAEVFKYACLSSAELNLDNVVNGPMEQEFQKRLAAAIAHDRRHKGQFLGQNNDRSDDPVLVRNWRNTGAVTFNGVST